MSCTDRLAWARYYVRRDLKVFPVRRRGKEPAIANPHAVGTEERRTCKGECGLDGHGVHDATDNDDKLVAWFGRTGPYRNANIGLAIPVGFIVMDVDTQHGGDVTFKTWCREHGADWLIDVPRQRSGNGGVHIWFRHDGELPRVTVDKNGIELRRVGQYMIVEPSIHETGNAYKWEVELP